jgi:hypothetical protein
MAQQMLPQAVRRAFKPARLQFQGVRFVLVQAALRHFWRLAA